MTNWTIFRSRLLLLSVALFLSSCSGPNPAYKDLLVKLEESNALEKRVFDQLVFTLSPKRANNSRTFKFLVRDQLGRDWLFKAGSFSAMDGAIANYRVFKSFGIETPEIHYKTFLVNGTPVTGSLQRFFPNHGPLNSVEPGSLTERAAEYVAKNHVLSWLLTNHQVHPLQFLVTGINAQNRTDALVRVDNGMEWWLFGNDRLSIDFQTPFLWFAPRVGYGRFWRARLLKATPQSLRSTNDIAPGFDLDGFEMDFSRLYSWVLFISDFPNPAYEDYFKDGIKNKLQLMANSDPLGAWLNAPEVMLASDPAKFLKNVVGRKKELKKDFHAFYTHFASLEGRKLSLPNSPNHQAEAAEIIRRLGQLNEAHRADEAALMALKETGPQQEFSVQTSYQAFEVLVHLLAIHRVLDPKEREEIIRKITSRLQGLESKNPAEKKAIEVAVQNVKELGKIMNVKPRDWIWETVLHSSLFFVQDYIKLRNSQKGMLTKPM